MTRVVKESVSKKKSERLAYRHCHHHLCCTPRKSVAKYIKNTRQETEGHVVQGHWVHETGVKELIMSAGARVVLFLFVLVGVA